MTVLGDNGLARLRELRAGDGKDIWLFGGGSLFGRLASAGLVDVAELSVMPVMLGAGHSVISDNSARVKLRLLSSEHSAGVLSLKYSVQPPT